MAFGSKESTPSFVLTLPLDINLNEQNYLYKEFKKCGTIYNQLVSATTKMWHQLHKTHEYRALMAAIAKTVPISIVGGVNPKGQVYLAKKVSKGYKG